MQELQLSARVRLLLFHLFTPKMREKNSCPKFLLFKKGKGKSRGSLWELLLGDGFLDTTLEMRAAKGKTEKVGLVKMSKERYCQCSERVGYGIDETLTSRVSDTRHIQNL